MPLVLFPIGSLDRAEQLPCGSDGFGFSQLGDGAELLRQAQSIPVDPTFCHLSANEADDGYSGYAKLLPVGAIPLRSPL